MPETKTNKMEREWTNEEKEKQTNETQISKSLNLKSKSKPISFQSINKEKERRGTPERQRENEPASWVRKRWTEKDSEEREKVIEEKEWCRGEIELDYAILGLPFLPPWNFFLTWAWSQVPQTQLSIEVKYYILDFQVGVFHYFNPRQLKYLRWGALIFPGSRVW